MIHFQRSRRSERVGRTLVTVGMLTMAVGLTVSSAAAAGENATAVLTSPLSGASTTFTWSYEFHQNGGPELSNIAISFCSADILAHVASASPSGEAFLTGDVAGGHTGFGPGVKFAVTAVSGTLTVVFDQAYTAGGIMEIQSHSGDGQSGDLTTTATGPGTCSPTTTTTVSVTTTTVPVTTTTVPVTTTTVPATTTTTVPGTTTTAPAITTTTAPVITTTSVPTSVLGARFTAPTTAPPTTTTSVPTSVLGARFARDGMAKTGFDGGPLVAFGAIALLLGSVLLLGGSLERAGE